MLMSLGMFAFALPTLAHDELQRRMDWRHARTARIGARDATQYVGPGDETISLGEMLDYSLRGAGKLTNHANRLMPLRRYLIAAIATLARPDAIIDMSVAVERGQWIRDDRRFALNPRGRLQTRKHRPLVPVGPNLEAWLAATEEWFVVHEREIEVAGETEIEQRRVASIRSAWDTMRVTLKLPAGWGPKLLRHSMATELRKRRVDPWELSGQLGHRVLATSETYAAFAPDYLGTVQAGITDVFSELERLAGQAVHPSFTRAAANVAALPLSKMAENGGKRGGRSRV
jgi:phage protein U